MRLGLWLSAPLLVSVVSGCTWVKSEPGAFDVDLKAAQDVTNCQKLGSATTKTKDSFVFDRNADKVAIELLTLARNEAVNQGGNAVVPTSQVEDGRQTFAIYKCP